MKNIRKQIAEQYPDEQIWLADGYDKAILGVDGDSMRAVYSVKKTLEIIYKETIVRKSDLSKEEIESGMTVEDKRMEMATEHFEFNVRGSKGEKLPIWVDDVFE